MIDPTTLENFWKWFVRHEAELLDFESDRERIFDNLAAQMQKVHPNLCFEFGPMHAQREFVISAGGIENGFPAVVALAKAAPELSRWRVTAFRPRRIPLPVVEFQDELVDPQEVEFSLLDNCRIAGVILFIPGFREDVVAFKQIGYLLLDEALGEYDVETKVGLIKMLPPEAGRTETRHPLNRLPEYFDQLIARLESRSGKTQ